MSNESRVTSNESRITSNESRITNHEYGNLVLSEIWIYPIKSLGGISMTSTLITKRGLQHDRRWMLVDEDGVFLTQRNFHEMALLQVEIAESGLKVYHKLRETNVLEIPFDAKPLESLTVKIWDDECSAYTVSEAANVWFSEMLNQKCRLVYMPDDSLRQVDERYAEEGDITGFSDGYPILIIGQSALDNLNNRLEESVSMNRFRPNLVFTGGEPNVEDTWKIFEIGEATFYGVKPCARCVMTTINQNNGKSGKEPLKTLATYRKFENKILFGQNIIPQKIDVNIHLMDKIMVLKC
ncbi:MAG: MOSC domain-containing protein [Saprospiraceae bacterium]|nr:MOSC domain-containing protein [Saprospiraceae bacterium]